MSEATFTPGPWDIDKNVTETNYLICCDISARNRGYVASLSTTNEDALNNAQLIAAAPDLLEALNLIVSYPYCDASPLEDPLVMKLARAAINKAEGKPDAD